MANTQSSQAFYNLTLEPSSAVTDACACNAIPGLRLQDQQIFEARGTKIYLHQIIENKDRSDVKLSTLVEHDVFGIVRGLSAFRIPGTSVDQLVVSSDAGRIVLLNYDHEKNAFKQIHEETFGKSGIRRTVPGQYLASDPRGRCCMLASTEKNKVVYIVNRNSEGGVLISSPHEANQWATLCFAVCALDTGWEHPVFAALEVEYSDAERDSTGEAYQEREKQLVYYTVDLGLNHVVKSWSDKVDYSANMLFGVPGGQDGPSGVLVCCDDRIYYRHDKARELCIQIPRRKGATEDPNRKRCIVAGCLHLSRSKHEFFFLLQTEDGDVFKLTIDMEKDAQGRPTMMPRTIRLKYYDTFPVAKHMVLIRKGYLYIATENGNNQLYHVSNLANVLKFEPWNNFTSDGIDPDPDTTCDPVYFKPRGFRYTSLAVEVPSLHPLMRAQVDNPLNEDAPQIYAIQGTGNRSVFKTIRHGLEIQEIVSSDLGNAEFSNLWSLKHRATDPYHSYLLLSSDYADKTIVLSIGDEVETMENSPFLANRATLEAGLMGDATLVQVHARGVRSILESGNVNEWPTPSHRTVVAASANDRQLLLGLSSAELAFFFMGDDGVLNQLEEMPEMDGKVTALSVGQTPKGQVQAKFAVVGCDDCTIRVFSIDLDSPLEPKSVQALSAVPTSLEIVEQVDPSTGVSITYVHIGLQSGLYLRAVIDEVSGELGEVRTKFLGAKPTRLFPVEVPNTSSSEEGRRESCVLASSARPWLGYNHPLSSLYTLTPLKTAPLDAARGFVSEHINGLCAIQGANLLIFELAGLDGRLATEDVRLKYTPRAMTRAPWGSLWYVVQSEGNSLSEATKQGLITSAPAQDQDDDAQTNGHTNGDRDMDADEDEEQDQSKLDEEAEELEQLQSMTDDPDDLLVHLGLPRGAGHWASCVSVVDPYDAKSIIANIEFTENEAALCVAAVQFESREWAPFIAVGTGQHMQPGVAIPGQQAKGYVHVFEVTDGGRGLTFVHKTEFNQPIYAIQPFHGRLALGVGPELLVYDIGMRALLRKSRGIVVPNTITGIQSQGNRIICSDVSESVTYVVYKPESANRLIPFVDDTIQRWTTATTMLDYETVAGGDKFGNLWVVRCPEQASKEADEEGIGGHITNERSYLGGAPYRLELRAHTFLQDIPTSLQRTALVAGGQEVLFYAGLQGTLGIMIPFVSREDVEFFSQLESAMRQVDKPLAGRDHLMFRSYYVPVKGVVDGDLCERFLRLTAEARSKVEAELEREGKEIERKVLDLRTRVAF